MRWKQLAGRNAATWAVVAALLPLTAMHDVAQHRATATPAGIGANCLPPQQTIKPSTPGNAVVTLPTGDQVRLTTLPGGRDAVNPVLANGKTAGTGSAGLVRFSMGGDAYAVPYAAVPYLGSLLDPNLFDVSYLARARLDDAHSASLPVTVTYRTAARSARLALPGVRAAGTGTTLTKSRAPALGSLLAAGWRALHAGHRLAASDPLNGLARISLAPASGSPAPPALPAPGIVQTGSRPHGAPPHYHTLTVNLVGRDGKPGVALTPPADGPTNCPPLSASVAAGTDRRQAAASGAFPQPTFAANAAPSRWACASLASCDLQSACHQIVFTL